jgi:hypothetical protein
MMLPAQRKCDVCSQPIEAGTKFLRVRYELYEDNKPQAGSAGGGSIHATNEVEAHEACCAPDFFLLLDLHRRSKSDDRTQRNRWSHENVAIDPNFAAAVVGAAQKGSPRS